MVRPENVVITAASDATDEMENTIEGTVNESLILGGVIRHYVAIPDGRVFVSVELNRPGLRVFDKGNKVRLGWRAIDMRTLAANADEMTGTP
jgi:putative spermidine/putrescine transport system ATP-binding protein